MSKQDQPGRGQKRTGVLEPKRARKWWLLLLSLLCVLGAGLAYGWQYRAGLRGIELLGFTAKWLCIPFGAGLLLLFAYFTPSKKRVG